MQQEVDYIEEVNGKMSAFELKWNPKTKIKFPKTFLNAYPSCEMNLITPDNFETFLGIQK